MSSIINIERGSETPIGPRAYGQRYFHLPTGKLFEQKQSPLGNNWQEVTDLGAEYLNDLLDVNAPTPLNGYVLAYSAILSKYQVTYVKPGKTLIVSSQGFPAAFGGDGSFIFPFSSIAEARDTAVAGDTIVIYPGTYSNPGNLFKDGVNYYFMPGAEVNSANSQIFSPSAPNETCNVYGHGVFYQTSGGASAYILLDQAGCSGVFEAKSIKCYGTEGMRLVQGDFSITVEEDITMLNAQALLYFRLTSGKFYVKAARIEHLNPTNSQLQRVIFFNGFTATAEVTIECPYMTLVQGHHSEIIEYVNVPMLSTPTVIGNVYDPNPNAEPYQASVRAYGSLKLIGNITTSGPKYALYVDGSNAKTVEFIGNIYHTNANDSQGAIGVNGNNSTVSIKGDIYSDNKDTIVLTGATCKTTFDGNIYNSHDDSTIVRGIVNNNAGHDLIIEHFKAIFDAAVPLAGSYPISGTNTDVRLYGVKLLSNLTHDAALIDLTTGASPLNYLNII